MNSDSYEDLKRRLAALETAVAELHARLADASAQNAGNVLSDDLHEYQRAAPTRTESADAEMVGFGDLERRILAILNAHGAVLADHSDRLERLRELIEHGQHVSQALGEDVESLRRQREDITAHLLILRQAFRTVDLRLRKLEAAGRGQTAPGSLQAQKVPAPGTNVTRRSVHPAPQAPRSAVEPIGTPFAAVPAQDRATSGAPHATGIIHFEEDAEIQSAIENVARKWACQYQKPGDPRPESPAGEQLLMVNLALSGFHPLTEIASFDALGISEPIAFTYCADANLGAVFGMVRFFPAPFDIHACVQRLLGRRTRPQRLLVVGEAFEEMNALKDALAQAQCGISMAFDARQALDLVPMLKPDLALLDLNMPKGEALRLAVTLRAHERGATLPLGFFWTESPPQETFRQQVLRAIRDVPFTVDALARALTRTLTSEARDW